MGETMAALTALGSEAHDRVGAFWWQWVVANCVAEMVGLGASALAAGLLLFGPLSEQIVLRAVGVVIISTALEGSTVGVAQWWVLHRRLRSLPAAAWIGATALGAAIAWSLGMIPSTLMDLGEASGDTGPTIAPGMEYVLAVGMGLVLGPILGTPQWWVLRRYVDHAGWWVPANAAAWAVGMPIIFAAAGIAYEQTYWWQQTLVVVGGLAMAGAAVGAVHGWVLVRLLRAMRHKTLTKP